MQSPSIGRIVLTHDQYEQLCPAIVTRVHTDICVNARIFVDSLPERTSLVEVTDPAQLDQYRWMWPPRV